jgi:short-subunit dehydrogenase
MTRTTNKDGALKRRYGPTALITGASDGIGRAFAAQLAEHGFDLILVARRDSVLQDLAQDLRGRFGVDVRVAAMDLSGPEAVPELLTMTEFAPVGLVVAAAGFGSIGTFLDQDGESESNMVDLNCRSVVELSYGFGTRMAAQRRGGIVLFGSLVPGLFPRHASALGSRARDGADHERHDRQGQNAECPARRQSDERLRRWHQSNRFQSIRPPFPTTRH